MFVSQRSNENGFEFSFEDEVGIEFMEKLAPTPNLSVQNMNLLTNIRFVYISTLVRCEIDHVSNYRFSTSINH
ncbi:hypothetical protein QVD17_06402 [Tagetes erecta]|uniref:Uncharacterized protein n=1 Tax=Tagetes erecta TaxID=13708 RepID=A0AAD8LJA9_TARER|nr:hypothetical protein QVD17_06402 [Tagetes erecta]